MIKYILGLLAIALAFFGLTRLAPRRRPTAEEIEREREKVLAEKALEDLDKGIEKLREDVDKREKDKSPEDAQKFWENYLDD